MCEWSDHLHIGNIRFHIYTVKFEFWILILIIYFIGKIECSIIIVLHLHFDIEHAFNIYKTAVLKSDKEN